MQKARVIALDEPYSGVDPASASVIDRLLHELRDEGRTILLATHDIEQAKAADRVLCLNRTQIAFGPPASVLDRSTLQATYGHELMLLDGGPGNAPVIAVQHHHHHDH